MESGTSCSRLCLMSNTSSVVILQISGGNSSMRLVERSACRKNFDIEKKHSGSP